MKTVLPNIAIMYYLHVFTEKILYTTDTTNYVRTLSVFGCLFPCNNDFDRLFMEHVMQTDFFEADLCTCVRSSIT